MAVSFSDLQLAFEFVSSGGMGENQAYLDRQSGKISRTQGPFFRRGISREPKIAGAKLAGPVVRILLPRAAVSSLAARSGGNCLRIPKMLRRPPLVV